MNLKENEDKSAHLIGHKYRKNLGKYITLVFNTTVNTTNIILIIFPTHTFIAQIITPYKKDIRTLNTMVNNTAFIGV
ncbi:MAG TPA: hypothetical protein VIR32_05755, partial [Lachnospiraceae bacterium]